jgi:1-acyl-sn-glycerol-3-phosphate acyltransferase
MKLDWNWLFRYVLLGLPLRFMCKVHVVGRENLPANGPFILAIGSHTTELESALVQVYLREYTLRFFAKAEYWRTSKLHAWFMTQTGQIPLERLDPRSANLTIDIGASVLRHGEILAMYPEGTRSRDGKLHKGRAGVVRTAIRGGAVIVPVGLIGFDKLNPPGHGIRRGLATMIIGRPIDPVAFHGIADVATRITGSTKALEATLAPVVTEHLMHVIARLCHKEYSGEYLSVGEASQ